MCELCAISSLIKTSPTTSLHKFSQHGGKTGHHSDGWGLAEYEGTTALIHKESKAAAFSQRLKYLKNYENKTQCAICHIRKATVGEIALRNTQPFVYELQGHSHVFAHNGDLKNIWEEIIFPGEKPVGETDSEYAFYYLMSFIKELWHNSVPTLDQRINTIAQVFTELEKLGPANFIYSDGNYLYAFANKRIQHNGKIEPPGMYWLTRQCNDVEDNSQEIVLFSSVPLTKENWQPVPSGQLFVVQTGKLITPSS
ncbi:class II glutamine amidotransferase [Vibrio albus]|uniref:Class II glutamine amidotransferase n=1 Tax=Vibrio albus TaxID=2200953 RepID=A0A2U3B9T9_9VIBR|nr:class II glutamine amidotransferase [Vibrio albus]PWI33569.1 class II glutamine amidotransferase [Vibrio albus]